MMTSWSKTVTRTNSFFALLMLTCGPTSASAESVQPRELCLDSRIRQAAAESLGIWAQQFAFAKALIGADARFGDVGPPRSVEKVGSDVVCLAYFNLVRVASTGRPYAVAIADYAYRVTATGEGSYSIQPANLPNTVSSEAEMTALLDRFTVDGRPYRETIADNLKRLKQGAQQ